MSIVEAVGITWHIRESGAEGLPPLVMLHGFAGSSNTWDLLVSRLNEQFRVLLIDLPGFGGSSLPERGFGLWELSDALAELTHIISLPKAYWCGYSMGGRIALHVALQHPGIVNKLAVIGASPGIADSNERAQRRASDAELAANIRARGIEWFQEFWSNLPLFASQRMLDSDTQAWLKQERLANDPEGLALALESWGPGEQEWLLPKLADLRCPVLLMAGERDDKFLALSQQIAHVIPSCELAAVPNAGHAAHIENPEVVSRELRDFFNRF